jgi:predicted dehydrogenase
LNALAERDDVEVTGLVDLEPARAAATRDTFGLASAAVSSDLSELLHTTGADIVFDCTVPAAHPHVTATALRHGCHVFGEKPLALTLQDARNAIAMAEKHERVYAVMQNRRYLDGVIRLRDFLQSGVIGQITTLNADFYIGARFSGFRAEMPHILLMDMAIHTFDQARFVSVSDAQSVYCHEWNPVGSWFRQHASAMAIFEMSNDLVFNYRGSWCAVGLRTPWACTWRAVGTSGSVWWDGEDTFLAEIAEGGTGFLREARSIEVPVPTPLKRSGHAGAIDAFLDCLHSGRRPQTDCNDNIKSLSMVLGAIESAEREAKIHL